MLAWGNFCNKAYRNQNFMVTQFTEQEKIVGKSNCSEQFRKLINHYKRIGYNPYVMRQTACLVINIWILSKPLNLIGCQSNRKAKFAEKYSKIISKVTLSFYSCLLRWASVAHWPLVILRPDSCVYAVILCFENSYNMSLKLLSKLELELLCSRRTTRPYFVQLMTLGWPWLFLRQGQICFLMHVDMCKIKLQKDIFKTCN